MIPTPHRQLPSWCHSTLSQIAQRMLAYGSLALAVLALATPPAQSQSSEERFQDLFSTAGYACAFGATLGVAALAFQPEPEKHLKFIAIGASLGFIGGSLLGSYVVFSPIFAGEHSAPATANTWASQPIAKPDDYAVTGVSARWRL